MRLETILFLGAGSLLMGCFDSGSGPTREEADSGNKPGPGPMAARTTSNTHKYFYQHQEIQYNGGSSVERFIDCDQAGVLVGFGGRVNGDGNFTDVTAHCRDIDAHGSLKPVYTRYVGGTSQETHVVADDGYVAVGIAGRVDNENLTVAKIRQCQWDAGTRSINTSACSYKPSGSAHELYFEYSGAPHQYKVLTGVGLTAGHESLSSIRVTVGELRPVIHSVHLSPVNIGYDQRQAYSFEVPSGAKWAAVLTSGGTGNLDLFLRKDYPPTIDTVLAWDCASWSSDNRESCEVSGPGIYHVLLRGNSSASGAAYDVKYSNP